VVKFFAFSATCLLLLTSTLSHAEDWRYVNEYLLTSDSDNAEQQAIYLGALKKLHSSDAQAGIWLGQWRFDEPVGSESFDVLRLSYAREMSERTDIEAQVSLTDGADWTPVLGRLTVVHRPSEQWRIESSVEKGWVDSVLGLRQELGLYSYSVSADWRFANQWTLVGSLLGMSIDDGNDRKGAVARLIYEVASRPGLTLQTRSKWLNSKFNGNGYFSPDRLQEHLLLVGYARPLLQDRWSLRTLAGAGTQTFRSAGQDEINNDLYYLEIGIRGWFSDHLGLEGKAYCSNAGGPNQGAPDNDYRYCNLGLSIIASY
jgi:hypothetical protein